MREEEVIDMRIVVAACATVLLLLVVGQASADVVLSSSYQFTQYEPDEQLGSGYDCPYINRMYVRNDFVKHEPRLGKAIFIDNNGGNWIAADEDNNYRTILNRPDLETTTKKGSVKNTSTYTYIGYGQVFIEDTHWCV